MKKLFVLVSALTVLLIALPIFAGAQEAQPLLVKGALKAVSNKAKTISASVEGKGVMVFKFNEQTVFMNAKDLDEILPGDAVEIDYRQQDAENVAILITRAVAKLSAGITEIKTAELAELIAKGPESGKYLLIDSRPAGKCSEGYIPTSVNIPVPVLEKEGEKVLPADKGMRLIFYCGGPT